MHRPSAARGLSMALGSLVLLTALASAASGQVATLGSPAAEASTAPASAPPDDQEALLQWAACMRDNGVEMDDPVFDAKGELDGGLGKGGTGVSADTKSESYQLALEACTDLLAAFKPPPDAAQQVKQTEQLLAWTACLREQGIDVPDPAADGSFGDTDWKVDLKGDEYIAADEACRGELGTASPK